MSFTKFSFSAFLLSFVSYKLYYMLVKFIITYFLLEITNSINLEFEDFPLLHNTSLQACVIGEVFLFIFYF